MIEPSAALVAGLIVGGGLGVIAGGLFASYRVKNAFELLDEAERLNDKLTDQSLRLLAAVERLTIRNRGYALAESKRQEQRVAAGAKGREVQAANRAAEKTKTDELHESMRAERRELVELI